MSITQDTVRTKIPARLDRLPWSSWHWRIVTALGAVWILDGLEVTIKGAVGPALTQALGFSTAQVGLSASIYIAGAISGSLFWGYLTDRYGRRRLFMITLAVYMAGVILTTISWSFFSFVIFRFITGFGIGGEYSAINSAIDELIPARARGWVDLAINGSYWFGALIADVLAFIYLTIFPLYIAWRIAFATGLILAVGLMLLRRNVPESPRWLMTHAKPDEAERITGAIEDDVKRAADVSDLPEVRDDEALELRERRSIGFLSIAKTIVTLYPRRGILGFSLMSTQAFLYNAIFFTYGLVISTYYHIGFRLVPLYLIPFAVGNFLGPLILGRFFDTVGRKPMISGSYLLSGVILIGTGWWFTNGLGLGLFTALLTVTFFFASAGASAGYLTVSETFPLEIRAMVIAFFYTVSTAFGGIVGPTLFGNLINAGDRFTLFIGYLIGAGLMIIGGITELLVGVKAEQKSLESIALPLSAAEADDGGEDEGAAEAIGLAPASASSIREFQQAHGLNTSGVVDAPTQAAIRATRAEQDSEPPDPYVLGVDVADAEAVRAFQHRSGLEPTGEVDAETRGALRVAQQQGFVDVLDEAAVRRFQDEHGLEPSGAVDRATQIAVAAVRADAKSPTEDREDGDEEDAGPRKDVLQALDELDVADAESVCRFQRTLGLPDDGVIGAETRGALRALRMHLLVDPADADEVATLQRRAGLPQTGVIDGPTRAALRAAVEDHHRGGPPPGPEPDPADAESVRLFQRRYGLDDDGEVGPRTQAAIRYQRDVGLGVDVTDPDSVRAFQAEHELEPDGVIGERTRAAMMAVRSLRTPGDDDERAERYGEIVTDDDVGPRLKVDPASEESVRRFQREHGLVEDGVIGPDTQTAMRAVRAARIGGEAGTGVHGAGPRPSGAHAVRRRFMVSGLGSTASIPDEDTDLDREMAMLVRELRRYGTLSRGELRQRLGARSWGPGRFTHALRVAVREGRIERTGRERYRVRARATAGAERLP